MNTPPKHPRPPQRQPSDPRIEALRARQSTFENETKGTFDAIARRDGDVLGEVRQLRGELAKARAEVRDTNDAQIVIAGELGVHHRLPASLRARSSAPPPLASGLSEPPSDLGMSEARPPVLPDIWRVARSGRLGIYLALALTLAQLALELLRHLGGF